MITLRVQLVADSKNASNIKGTTVDVWDKSGSPNIVFALPDGDGITRDIEISKEDLRLIIGYFK